MTSTLTPPARPVLGRGLAQILRATVTTPAFLHVTVRSSHLPPARKLMACDVRECGPRSGVSYDVQPWHYLRPLRGELTAADVAQLLTRLGK